MGLPGLARAEDPAVADQTIDKLQAYSLEDLGNLTVTSVSRRPESITAAPAAVYVITGEDIRRAGATSLPEALRLAPNVQVARINAYTYAVGLRGFNSFEASNKLLVQIDGRSVYSPAHSGVFWQSQDVMLADVDRIEVVAGPGGTLWGANAVNGVINVISKPASETKGLLVDGGGGDLERSLNLRYGASLGPDTAVRIYGGEFRRDDLEAAPGDVTQDAFRGEFGGFRADHQAGADDFTLQGDGYRNVDKTGEKLEGNSLTGRWTRRLSDTSGIEAQVYYERSYRGQAPVFTETLHTWDFQAQQDFAIGRHKVVWGGEYRNWDDDFQLNFIFNFLQPRKRLAIGNLFVQDAVALTSRLTLTAGLKAENSSYSGMQYLPNVRLAWRPGEETLLWAAVSRSVRTPSRIDRELQGGGVLAPSADFHSETLLAYEAGYRGQLGPRASITLNTFYNVYDDLRTTETTPPFVLPLVIGNGLQGESYGVEAWGAFDLTPNWRLKAGGSALHEDFHLKPGSTDIARSALGFDPDWQAQIRSEANLGRNVSLDVTLRTQGEIDDPATHLLKVPAFTEADARLAWRLRPALELSLEGFNLLHDSHVEYNNPSTSPVRRIPRSVYLGLRWGF